MNPSPYAEGGVRGFLHRPEGAPGDGVVLTHGAGGDCRSSLLVAAADAFAVAGLHALRIDLPFRQKRPKGPPSPSGAAADRAGLREAVAAMRRLVPGRVVLGGHSYGGRQATMLAAEEPALATSLVLFSYPLHPPGKPDRLRTEHFTKLRVPCVFVSGSADPFGSTTELQAVLPLIAAPTQFIPIEGAGHDLRRGRFNFAPIVDAVTGQLATASPPA